MSRETMTVGGFIEEGGAMMYNNDMPPDWMMALVTLALAGGMAFIIWLLVVTNP